MHARYEGAAGYDFFFLSMIATCTFITRMNHQRKHCIDFIYIFIKQINELMIKSTLLKIT